MNKRHVLLLTAVLGLAAPFAHAQTSMSPDVQLSTEKITVETGSYNGPLSSLLAAIARTAGYGLILDTDVDLMQTPASTPTAASGGTSTPTSGRPVVYSFKDKPFNEVWPLLMDVYGLSYEVIQVGGQPVLRVGNAPIQRIVALKNADATEVTNQVKLFFGTPTYTETPQKDAQGNVIGVTRTLADVKIDSATLRVVPDVRSNSVIVRGTNKEVTEVARILGQLDQPGKPTTATATPTNSQTVQSVYSVKGKQADIVALLTAQYPGLKITPVGQTGQLVITGPQNQMTAATTLLSQVDKPTPAAAAGPTTVQRVFQLVNSSAEEVKATLEGTLQKELTTSPVQRGTGTNLLDVNGNPISVLVPPSQQASADSQGLKTTDANATTPTTNPDMPTIIADKRTNTLIVRGTQLQVDQVAELIPQLDKVVPQINVQVRIQELTDQATRNLGLNANLNVGGFAISTASGTGLSASFDPTRTFMGFNIFPTLTALETQNLARRVYDGNVTMQSGQRALGNTSQTENASATAAATVKSGGSLEINIPSQAANIPSIQKTIDYGVILDFFNPQVAPDGTITVRVRGKVNTPPANITANNIPYVLNFANSEAQSLVTFKSGETLLLAGLMGNSTTNNTSGVPLISKFGIGGNVSKESRFSQLLVIITGNIVK